MMKVVDDAINAVLPSSDGSGAHWTTPLWIEGKRLLEGVFGFVNHDDAFDAVGYVLQQGEIQQARAERAEAEVVHLRNAIREMDARFGHFAAMHTAIKDGTPTALLGDLAHMVHEAAQAAEREE